MRSFKTSSVNSLKTCRTINLIILECLNLLCCDGPKTYHRINLTTMSVNWAPALAERHRTKHEIALSIIFKY